MQSAVTAERSKYWLVVGRNCLENCQLPTVICTMEAGYFVYNMVSQTMVNTVV